MKNVKNCLIITMLLGVGYSQQEVTKSIDQSAFIPLEKEFNKIIGDYYSQKKLTSILEKIDKLSEQK